MDTKPPPPSTPAAELSRTHPVLLFDGVCNLCNDAVNRVIRHDPEARFRFAALQSDAGQALLKEHGLATSEFDSFVLVEGGRVHLRSTAALRVARKMRFPYSWLWPAIILPRFLRDWVYGVVARNRYRWFGRTDVCRVPTPDLAERFLA